MTLPPLIRTLIPSQGSHPHDLNVILIASRKFHLKSRRTRGVSAATICILGDMVQPKLVGILVKILPRSRTICV